MAPPLGNTQNIGFEDLMVDRSPPCSLSIFNIFVHILSISNVCLLSPTDVKGKHGSGTPPLTIIPLKDIIGC